MILGNKHAQQMMQKMIGQSEQFPFVLLAGPAYLGKAQWLHDYLREQVHGYTQDILSVRDMTELLGKQHTLPVKSTGKTITIQDDSYDDIGAREIVDRMARSPSGTTKYVLIENIERASIGAINALLKELEEPLPHRQIIATTSNKERVLPTILSRAALVSATLVDDQTIADSIAIDADHQSSLLAIAQGRPRLAAQLAQDTDQLQQLHEQLTTLQSYWSEGHLTKLYKHLQSIEKSSHTQLLLMALTSWLDQQQEYESVATIQRSLAMRRSNVAMDTILFSIALYASQR